MCRIIKILCRLVMSCALLGPACVVVKAELPPAPKGSFSIVVLPDTQAYSAGKPEVFHAQTQWIIDNLKRQQIKFVSHVGDIVDRNVKPQWKVAREAMDKLHGKVPYGFSVGNHDMIGSSGDSSLFQETFPASRFERFTWYGGSYQNNRDSFQLFSAQGLDFVVVHLECNAPDDVLRWTDGVLEKHRTRRAIVTTHMYLGPRDRPKTPRDFYDAPKGRMRWKKCHGQRGNTPEQMWQKCFRKHKNLLLVCCGDQSRTQAMHRTVKAEHGNTVCEVLSDYREGYLRLCRFLPRDNRIEFHTYSPYLDKVCHGTEIIADATRHQFTIPYRLEFPK